MPSGPVQWSSGHKWACKRRSRPACRNQGFSVRPVSSQDIRTRTFGRFSLIWRRIPSNNDGMHKSVGSLAVLAVLSSGGLTAGTAAAAPYQSSNPTTSLEAAVEAAHWWAYVDRAQAYRDQLRPPADAAYVGLPVDAPTTDDPAPVEAPAPAEAPVATAPVEAPVAPAPAPVADSGVDWTCGSWGDSESGHRFGRWMSYNAAFDWIKDPARKAEADALVQPEYCRMMGRTQAPVAAMKAWGAERGAVMAARMPYGPGRCDAGGGRVNNLYPASVTGTWEGIADYVIFCEWDIPIIDEWDGDVWTGEAATNANWAAYGASDPAGVLLEGNTCQWMDVDGLQIEFGQFEIGCLNGYSGLHEAIGLDYSGMQVNIYGHAGYWEVHVSLWTSGFPDLG